MSALIPREFGQAQKAGCFGVNFFKIGFPIKAHKLRSKLRLIQIQRVPDLSKALKYKGKQCKSTTARTGPRGQKIHRGGRKSFQSAPEKKGTSHSCFGIN
jgi:hypothetical protein